MQEEANLKAKEDEDAQLKLRLKQEKEERLRQKQEQQRKEQEAKEARALLTKKTNAADLFYDRKLLVKFGFGPLTRLIGRRRDAEQKAGDQQRRAQLRTWFKNWRETVRMVAGERA